MEKKVEPPAKAQSQAKKEKLAKALRDNLRRRKAPAPSPQKDKAQ